MAKDMQAFLTYLTSLWGALPGVTAVFPLADVFLKVLPLPVGSYQEATAPIVIPLTSLVAIFILMYSFVQRNKPATPRHALVWFVLGLIALFLFFLVNHFEYALRTMLFPNLDSTDDYALMLVGVVPFYIAFFACVSRAFAILALREFQQQ